MEKKNEMCGRKYFVYQKFKNAIRHYSEIQFERLLNYYIKLHYNFIGLNKNCKLSVFLHEFHIIKGKRENVYFLFSDQKIEDKKKLEIRLPSLSESYSLLFACYQNSINVLPEIYVYCSMMESSI